MQVSGMFKKSKMLINIIYRVVIYVVYQKEKVNYMSNKNALAFMNLDEGLEVDWAHTTFKLCHVAY
jgi:hypothetical protein